MTRAALLLLRVTGAGALLMLVAIPFSPAANLAAQALAIPDDPRPSDAIVVLGASIRTDGKLGDASLRRTIVGIEQLKLGLAPRILLLGARSGSDVHEDSVRAELAQQLGVSEAQLLTDHEGQTTREEARRARELLRPLGATSIVLVSDGLHLRRARRAFALEGLTVSVVSADTLDLTAEEPERRLLLARATAQQALAWALYRIREYQ